MRVLPILISLINIGQNATAQQVEVTIQQKTVPKELVNPFFNGYLPTATKAFVIRTSSPKGLWIASPINEIEIEQIRTANCYRCGLKNQSAGVTENNCRSAELIWGGTIDEVNQRCR